MSGEQEHTSVGNGDLPPEWNNVKFADSVSIKNGQVDPRVAPYDSMLHVGSKDIESGSGRFLDLKTNRELKVSSGNYHFTPDDVLYSKIRPYLNKVALPDFEGTCSADMYPLRSNDFNREFLFFILLGDDFLKAAMFFQDRTGIPKINRAQLSGIRLPLPPLPEQKKIAQVQRAIEAQERIIQTTTELKKALMHKLFTEALRNEPQKQTEIGLVPESWQVVPLSDVSRFQSGGTPSKKNPEFWQGEIPWVSPKDMKRPRLDDVKDHISQEALESGSKLAPAGSVFVVVRGMILAKTVPVALAEVPMAINQDMKAIVPGPKLRSDFLLYALETLRGNLFKKVGRSGHGTCTLMSHEIAAFKIPLPELETQKEVAATIQNLERKMELHEEKQTQFQDLFRTLLHELMTAKTRVNHLNIAAAKPGASNHERSQS